MIRRTLRTLLSLLLWTGLATSLHAADESMQNLLSAGRVDDLIVQLGARIRTNPGDTSSYQVLGQAYLSLGDLDKAVDTLERGVAVAPRSSAAHLWLGRAYGEKADKSNFFSAIGWAKKTRSEFEQAVALDPSNIEARSDLTEFYLSAPGIIGGGIDKARKQIEFIERQDPGLAHFLKSGIQDKKGDRAGAERELYAAIQTSDDPARYWMNLASSYQHLKRFDDMEKAISSGISATRKRSDVLFYAADMLFQTRRNLPTAVTLLREYAANPDQAVPAFKAHYLLGAVLETMGKNEEAASEYKAALLLASQYSQARQAFLRLQKANNAKS
jgi:tetratricopeptide (TPR) repeat protein